MAEFTCSFKASSVAGLNAALDRIVAAAVEATPSAVFQAAAIVQGKARDNASHRPGPNVISGDLRRSIIVGAGDTAGPVAGTTARIGVYRWSSVVGPTVIYGRIQELGGDIYPHHMARSGSGRPGMLGWGGTPGHRLHFARHVRIPARPYLSPALVASLPEVQQRFYDVWAAAMRGVVPPPPVPSASFTPTARRAPDSAFVKQGKSDIKAGYRHGEYNWAANVKFRKPPKRK